MLTVLAALISGAGSFFGGLFGWKGAQAETVQKAIDLLKSVNDVDAQTATATATILSQILTNGIWIEKVWRPLLMMECIVLISCYWFGYVPPYFDKPMTPMMVEMFTLLKIGVGGYIPCRTIEKVMNNIQLASVLKTLIAKKLI